MNTVALYSCSEIIDYVPEINFIRYLLLYVQTIYFVVLNSLKLTEMIMTQIVIHTIASYPILAISSETPRAGPQQKK